MDYNWLIEVEIRRRGLVGQPHDLPDAIGTRRGIRRSHIHVQPPHEEVFIPEPLLDVDLCGALDVKRLDRWQYLIAARVGTVNVRLPANPNVIRKINVR